MGIQEQLNALGGCCDERKSIEITTTYQITIKERVCVPVTYQSPIQQQTAEIDSKLNQINIPPDLSGEISLVRKTWNYL